MPDQSAKVCQLIEQLAQSLVDQPQRVEVGTLRGESVTIFELRVAPEDVGKVIGKQGRIARSMRILLGAMSMSLKQKFALDIIDKNGCSRQLEDGAGAVANLHQPKS